MKNLILICLSLFCSILFSQKKERRSYKFDTYQLREIKDYLKNDFYTSHLFENSKDTSKPSLDITGKIVGEGTVAHFIFEPKGSGMRIFSIQRGDSDWNAPPQYLRGTYSYVHAGEPSVGEVFLQSVESIETAKRELLGKHAPAEAQSMLSCTVLYTS